DWEGSSTSAPLITRSNLSSGPMAARAGPAPAAASALAPAPARNSRRELSRCDLAFMTFSRCDVDLAGAMIVRNWVALRGKFAARRRRLPGFLRFDLIFRAAMRRVAWASAHGVRYFPRKKVAMTKRAGWLFALMLGGVMLAAAQAQPTYPDRPIRIV